VRDHPKDILQFFAWTAVRLRRHEKEIGKDAAVKYSDDQLMDLDWHPRWRNEAPDSGTLAQLVCTRRRMP
jgi:hypothetical protein